TERQAVAEYGHHFEVAGQDREQDQSGLGGEDEEYQQARPAARAHFGTDLDANVLRYGVAQNLADDERRLEGDLAAEKLFAVEAGGRERLAEGVHAKVSRECRRHRVGNEGGAGRRRQLGTQALYAEVHGTAGGGGV